MWGGGGGGGFGGGGGVLVRMCGRERKGRESELHLFQLLFCAITVTGRVEFPKDL